MCGRYVQSLRPTLVRQYLEDDGMPVTYAPMDDGPDAPRRSYNFAPSYYGLVYRADVPDHGINLLESPNCGCRSTSSPNSSASCGVNYKLQSMKWGLIPSWTKCRLDHGSIMRTINCRDDSLQKSGGLWASMKARKRCIVVAEGFYEWAGTGPRNKTPHYVKRKDGRLMYFAGLWDCVHYEDVDIHTYTIITTDSNRQLTFLHDRMPVIFEPGSPDCKVWLDPHIQVWSRTLQRLLRPSQAKLDICPVSNKVGKVGNDSVDLVIPVQSKDNRYNIANFFSDKAETRSMTLDSELVGAAKRPISGSGSDVFDLESLTSRKRNIISYDTPDSVAKRRPREPPEHKIGPTQNLQKPLPGRKEPRNAKITDFFSNSA